MRKQGKWLLSLCVATGMVGRGWAQTPELPAVDAAPAPVWPDGPALLPPVLETPAAPAPAAPVAETLPSLPAAPVAELPAPVMPQGASDVPPATIPDAPPPAPVAEMAPPAPTAQPATTPVVTENVPVEAPRGEATVALPEAVPVAPTGVTVAAPIPVPRLPEAMPAAETTAAAAPPAQPVTETTAAAPLPLPELPELPLPALDLTPSPVTHLPPPPAVAPAAPAKIAGNPYGQLREARELYGMHRYEEAETIARRLLPMQVSWAAMNDSPRKLLEDVGRARVHATQDGASLVLAEGRRALQNGDIDEAERLAQMAELIHGPQRWFAPDDSPSKLMADIRAARGNQSGENPIVPGPTVVTGTPLPAGAMLPTGAAQATARRGGLVSRISARFSKPEALPTGGMEMQPSTVPMMVNAEGAVTTQPMEPVVKARALPRLNNLKERIASIGHGPRPVAMDGMATQPGDISQGMPSQGMQLVNAEATTTPVVVAPVAPPTSIVVAPGMSPPPGPLPSELLAQAKPSPVVQASAVAQEGAPELLTTAPTPATTPPPPVAEPMPMAVTTEPAPAANPPFLRTPHMADASTPMPVTTTAPETVVVPPPPTSPVMTTTNSAPIAGEECDACAPSGKSLPFCLAGNVGFSLMRPYWKNNPAAFVAVGGPVGTGREIEFGLGTQFVPELSIGLIGTNNLGFRTNWWGFATSDAQGVSGPTILSTAAPLGLGLETGLAGSSLLSRASLRMNVWDLEVTRDFSGDCWAILVAGGLRYTHINQRYDADLRLPTGTVETLRSGHNFNGVGPTLFARGRRGMGAGLYLYGESRASLLFGRVVQDATTLTAEDDLNGALTGRMVMPAGEVAGGIGWRRDFDGMEVFAETGLVGQVWVEAGNSSRSVGANTSIVGGVGSPAIADHNLGLLGLTMRMGLNY